MNRRSSSLVHAAGNGGASPEEHWARQHQSIQQVVEAVSRADRLEDIYQHALDALGSAVGAARSAVLLLDEGGKMRFVAWRGLSPTYRAAVDGHSPWGPDSRDAAPVLVPDVSHDEALRGLADVILAEGIRALAFIPLRYQGRLLGKFMIYYDRVHRFTEVEVAVAQTIAAQIGFALGRRQLEESLQRQNTLLEQQNRSFELYRQVFMNSNEGIAIVDPQGRYLEQNPAHQRLTCYTDEDLAGKTPAIHLGEQAFAEVAAELERSGRYIGEIPSRRKTGELIDISLSAFSIRGPGGEVLYHVGIKHDITQRKSDERALRRSEEQQRFLAEVSARLDASLHYEQTLQDLADVAIPFLADRCQVHLADEGGKVRLAAMTPPIPSAGGAAPAALLDEAGVTDAIRSGRPVLYQDSAGPGGATTARRGGHARLEAGEVRSVLCLPLQARGRTLGALTLLREGPGRQYDDADREIAQEFARRGALALDNARLYAELQLANEAKDEFLSLVSHELRTPLTGIYGAVRVLSAREAQLTPQDRHDLITVLESESERMHRLVEDLLVLSRLELGQRVVLEPVMAQRILERLVSRSTSEHPITVEIAGQLPPVAAEPTFLEQVLRNLLDNARKYSPAGTGIEVHAAATAAGEVMIEVLDRGVGISPEEADRIFDRFYRSGRGPRGVSGMGIGLTVCKRLTEAQGGRIWAKPRDGGGLEIGFALRQYEGEELGAGS